MFSSNLRNSSYVFKNKQLSKEDYKKEAEKYLNSRENIKKAIKIFEEEVIKNNINKYASIINSPNSY